ncbi:hypothetical protein KC19_3G176300 [Ceratodon purpureus]|uniref:Uncharacterized protein n=1 Tax=Ceratodon purpureus TaxID=3225 RepID=A0A8T0INF5_CERPU|nr:hypothetical protein KC19_3G176300 [Ceratodon purpureus]
MIFTPHLPLSPTFRTSHHHPHRSIPKPPNPQLPKNHHLSQPHSLDSTSPPPDLAPEFPSTPKPKPTPNSTPKSPTFRSTKSPTFGSAKNCQKSHLWESNKTDLAHVLERSWKGRDGPTNNRSVQRRYRD